VSERRLGASSFYFAEAPRTYKKQTLTEKSTEFKAKDRQDLPLDIRN
jgi:hypothetical protein